MDVDLGCSSYLYLAALLELKGRGCREGGAVLVSAAPLAAGPPVGWCPVPGGAAGSSLLLPAALLGR